MVSDLTNKTIYHYNDMSNMIVEKHGEYLNLDFGKSYPGLYQSIEPINSFLRDLILTNIPIILGMNILTILFLLINFISFFILFWMLTKKFNYSRNIMLITIFAFIGTVNLYFLYRVISFTPNLYHIYILVSFIIYAISSNKKKIFLLLPLTVFGILTSVYYTFFGLIFIAFYRIIKIILGKDNMYNFEHGLYEAIIILLVLGGYYLILTNLHKQDFNNNYVIYRPIEDYYNFSMQPWYVVIPPKDSLLFGTFAKNIHSGLNHINYQLISTYDEYESTGSFIPWYLLSGAIVSIGILVTKPSFFSEKEKIFIKIISLSTFFIFLLALPPSYTIFSIKIYMPSYILYQVLPFIRVLSRFSILIYILVVILNFILFSKLIKTSKYKYLSTYIAITLVFLHLVFVTIRIPVINIDNPPYETSLLSKQEYTTIYYNPKPTFKDRFWQIKHNKKIASIDEIGKATTNSILVAEHINTKKRYCNSGNEIYSTKMLTVCILEIN